MTAAQPHVNPSPARHDGTGTTTVGSPLFLAPPPTDDANTATLTAQGHSPANDDKPRTLPILRFSAGN
ncbi:hypothetical protein LO763_19580 [Glycomyces sp. A-F 0318]|uniref:hypothetical protein n=1 Tax=Glycomyces amatae TaxID=2881355 RepID=UPI001E30A794|nr:hypothetical protein [Glycomyces amatae]MCD0445813.1 hypothetical protein [Glycomyces amatae]